MDLKSLKTYKFKMFLYALGTLIIAFIIFLAGVSVGFEKARFSFGLGERYYRDFFGGRHSMFDQNFVNSHGAAGTIASISKNEIIINDNGVSKTILVDNSTVIKKNRINAALGDLKAGDKILVIGAPNDQAQIAAKFIKVK